MAKKKILIVEDSVAISLYISDVIKRKGYSITDVVETGEDAVESARKERPDLILMDIILEGKIDGIEAAKIIRKNMDAPLIYLTASTDESTLERAKLTGPYGYIIKPVNDFDIISSVETALYRHKLESAYIESEKKFRSLFENMADAFVYQRIIHDKGKVVDLEILDINKTFENLFKTKRDYVLGRKISDVLPLKSRFKSLVIQLCDDIIKFKRPKKLKIYYKRINKWLNITGFIPKKNFVTLIIEDISESKIAELEVKENEEKFRLITETARDAIILIDNNGIVTCWNPASEKIFGFTENEVVGEKITKFIIPESMVKLHNKSFEIWRHVGTGNITGKTIELPAQKKDGSEIAVEFSLSSVMINDKWNALAILRDITDRKIAEIKVEKAHRDVNNLLSSIDSILIGVNVKDTITHWNSIAEKTFGVKSDELVGKKIVELPVSWEWDKIYEGICNSLSDKKQVKLTDVKYKDKIGKERILGVSINPITDGQGKLGGFLIYGTDITDRKVMEMQLIQDQKLKSIGELAAGIAHEINTPTQYVNDNTLFFRDAFKDIVEINTLIENLITNHKEGKICSDVIEEIEKTFREKDISYLNKEVPIAIDQSIEGLNHISKIVSSMKSFSHPGLNKKTTLDINKAITDTINISKNEWKYVSNITTEFDESNPHIFCFPAEINQVLLNIIINASHTIQDAIDSGRYEKGRIIISTELNNGHVEIKIKDNGMGIPNDVRGNIFDPFFTTKDIGKGTGQGLAIAHSIITEKHKGSIKVISKEGEGTSFIIKLPVQ